MKSELINEIYKNHFLESDNENNIEILSKKKFSNGISREQYRINKKTDNQDVGTYTLLNSKRILYDNDSQINMIKQLTIELKKYLSPQDLENVLIVGLGNRHINADSLGAKVVKNILITRHIPELKNLKKVSAIVPSVLGLTGIESFDIITSIVEKIKPSLVVAIDSLCASSHTRLGTSFQINNASLIPGGGVNNARKKLDANSLNTKFISIGVPLVIYANTFSSKPNSSLANLIVTLKDIEEISLICANIISYSINSAIHNINIEDVKDYLNKI